MYGGKGRMESAREGTSAGNEKHIYVKCDEYSGEYAKRPTESYDPKGELDKYTADFGHGGSDFYSMWNFVEKIKGNPQADTVDVYEALDMFLPGMFAYRSILNGNISMAIPNLRNKEEREKWRNDTACTDPETAGDMLLPMSAKGDVYIEDAVYERMADIWEREKEEKRKKETETKK